MCLHKYVLSGINELHTILCVDWLKNVNCEILRQMHATLFPLCRDIIALCHEKDWFSLLEVEGNYVAKNFLCRNIIYLS